MTKRDLIVEVATRLGFTQHEVSGIVHGMLDSITQALANGDRLEIRNFGVFEIKTRDARMGRNPRTGEEVPIEQKRVPTFKPGKALKECVQAGHDGWPAAPSNSGDSTTKPPGSTTPGEQQSLF